MVESEVHKQDTFVCNDIGEKRAAKERRQFVQVETPASNAAVFCPISHTVLRTSDELFLIALIMQEWYQRR